MNHSTQKSCEHCFHFQSCFPCRVICWTGGNQFCVSEIGTWQFLCALFGMVKWTFQGLSDLQRIDSNLFSNLVRSNFCDEIRLLLHDGELSALFSVSLFSQSDSFTPLILLQDIHNIYIYTYETPFDFCNFGDFAFICSLAQRINLSWATFPWHPNLVSPAGLQKTCPNVRHAMWPPFSHELEGWGGGWKIDGADHPFGFLTPKTYMSNEQKGPLVDPCVYYGLLNPVMWGFVS